MSLRRITQKLKLKIKSNLPFFKKTLPSEIPALESPIPLCPEILSMILKLLHPRDLLSLSQTCKFMKSLDTQWKVKTFTYREITRADGMILEKFPKLRFLRFDDCDFSGDLNLESFAELYSVQLRDARIPLRRHGFEIKLPLQLGRFTFTEVFPVSEHNRPLIVDARLCKFLAYFKVTRSESCPTLIFYPPQVPCLKTLKCPDSKWRKAYDEKDLGKTDWAKNIEKLELTFDGGFSRILSIERIPPKPHRPFGGEPDMTYIHSLTVPPNVLKVKIHGPYYCHDKIRIISETHRIFLLKLVSPSGYYLRTGSKFKIDLSTKLSYDLKMSFYRIGDE